MFNELITGTRNATKSPLDEYESIMGTKNVFKSPLDEFITGSKNGIQNSLNESITSAKMGFSKEINEKIFPSLPKKDFLNLPEQLRKQISDRPRISSGIQDQIEAFKGENAFLSKNNPLGLPEQLRKQISEKPRPSSGIQDVIENALKQRVETPLETLRNFFY
jgi:hypothetical protein